LDYNEIAVQQRHGFRGSDPYGSDRAFRLLAAYPWTTKISPMVALRTD
jgi:hypothetical protein